MYIKLFSLNESNPKNNNIFKMKSKVILNLGEKNPYLQINFSNFKVNKEHLLFFLTLILDQIKDNNINSLKNLKINQSKIDYKTTCYFHVLNSVKKKKVSGFDRIIIHKNDHHDQGIHGHFTKQLKIDLITGEIYHRSKKNILGQASKKELAKIHDSLPAEIKILIQKYS